MTHRTLVLGAGIAGLTAGATLARAGHDVTVLEAAAEPGGHGRSTEHDGTRVNLGAHAMFMRGPGVPILRGLGVTLAGGMPPQVHARFDLDGALRPAWDARLGGLPGAALGLARLAAAVRRDDHPDLASGPWLDDVIGDRPCRPLVDALSRVVSYTDLPAFQSADVLLAQLRAGLVVRYLDGGFQRIVEELATSLRAGGGALVTATRPDAVLIEGGRVRGVRTADGREHPADAVVIAVGGPSKAQRLLTDSAAAAPGATLPAAAARAVPARVASLDVVLEGRPANYRPFVIGIDEPLFLTTASDGADLGGPRGRTVLHLTRYLGLDEGSGTGHRGGMEELLERAAPGWRERALDVRFLPDITVSQDLVRVGGGGLAGRAPVVLPEVEGLYLAGDWVGPESYLAQASVCSGAAAARTIARTAPAGRPALEAA